jgi:hypothetical protein
MEGKLKSFDGIVRSAVIIMLTCVPMVSWASHRVGLNILMELRRS